MNLTISPRRSTALKICGITKIDQALTIASLDVNAIGVIGVKSSPRFLADKQRSELFEELINSKLNVERVWVVADLEDSDLDQLLQMPGYPSVIQLHGNESPQKCQELKGKYPMFKWWKAFQIKNEESLSALKQYEASVDSFLLDAWSNKALGGTGKRIPIEWLKQINFNVPWWLAGGISTESISEVLNNLNPYGIDASSKLEHSPGIKDIEKVKNLIKEIAKKNIN
tara:strand:- start:243 stop:923 length:681 start_codon:yes stop_codon:yes gene_type:complete